MHEGSRWAVWVAAGAAVLLGFTTLRGLELAEGPEGSICFLRRTTGLPCPSCGLTRATVAAAHGDWRASIEHHPFAVLLLIEGSIFWLAAAVWLAGWRSAPRAETVGRWTLAHVAVLIALWTGRAATGTLPW